MADKDDKKAPDSQDKQEEKVPSTPEEGQTSEETKEAPEQVIPDKLKDKSTEELVKMYGELERKLGEQSGELGQSRKYQEQMQVVLQAIYSDPNTEKSVRDAIAKQSGQKPEKPKVDENRRVLESQLIKDFERENGLDYLETEKKQEVYGKISSYLVDMIDPGGQMTPEEALEGISLTKLPNFLRNAFYLANREGEIKKATDEALAKARQTQAAAIGSIPSSGGVSESTTLTTDEQQTARKLGISDEDYLKTKQKLVEEKKKP